MLRMPGRVYLNPLFLVGESGSSPAHCAHVIRAYLNQLFAGRWAISLPTAQRHSGIHIPSVRVDGARCREYYQRSWVHTILEPLRSLHIAKSLSCILQQRSTPRKSTDGTVMIHCSQRPPTITANRNTQRHQPSSPITGSIEAFLRQTRHRRICITTHQKKHKTLHSDATSANDAPLIIELRSRPFSTSSHLRHLLMNLSLSLRFFFFFNRPTDGSVSFNTNQLSFFLQGPPLIEAIQLLLDGSRKLFTTIYETHEGITPTH